MGGTETGGGTGMASGGAAGQAASGGAGGFGAIGAAGAPVPATGGGGGAGSSTGRVAGAGAPGETGGAAGTPGRPSPGRPTSPFSTAHIVSSEAASWLVDIDHDGWLDRVAAVAGGISVMLNDRNGQLPDRKEPIFQGLPNLPLTFADLNGDPSPAGRRQRLNSAARSRIGSTTTAALPSGEAAVERSVSSEQGGASIHVGSARIRWRVRRAIGRIHQAARGEGRAAHLFQRIVRRGVVRRSRKMRRPRQSRERLLPK